MNSGIAGEVRRAVLILSTLKLSNIIDGMNGAIATPSWGIRVIIPVHELALIGVRGQLPLRSGPVITHPPSSVSPSCVFSLCVCPSVDMSLRVMCMSFHAYVLLELELIRVVPCG